MRSRGARSPGYLRLSCGVGVSLLPRESAQSVNATSVEPLVDVGEIESNELADLEVRDASLPDETPHEAHVHAELVGEPCHIDDHAVCRIASRWRGELVSSHAGDHDENPSPKLTQETSSSEAIPETTSMEQAERRA